MSLKVVFCSAEVAPYAKVGGLGDVAGSLPKALAEAGVTTSIVMPRYGGIDPEAWGLMRTPVSFSHSYQGQTERVGLWEGELPDSDSVMVYFLENDRWFASVDAVYPPGDVAFEQGRFGFFSECALKALRALQYSPDVVHVHDWHTARIPSYIEAYGFSRTRTVLTIHNLAYQGVYGEENPLAMGIRDADVVTTVSPTYAREIQTPELGCGLDGLLRERQGKLHGIVNGIDTHVFNPATDVHLIQNYDASMMISGKAACKAALQERFGLPVDAKKPVFGFVSRLVDQKGLDILLPAMEEALRTVSGQWVFLGAGDSRYESALQDLANERPEVAVHLGFDGALAQQIYAGSDFFLMPSRFEPCGLGQLIAMRYGSVPVVRATGGLADTVIDIRQDPEAGTGICFQSYDPQSLVQALRAAEGCFVDEDLWPALLRNGISRDFSWAVSAKAYCAIYNSLTQ